MKRYKFDVVMKTDNPEDPRNHVTLEAIEYNLSPPNREHSLLLVLSETEVLYIRWDCVVSVGIQEINRE